MSLSAPHPSSRERLRPARRFLARGRRLDGGMGEAARLHQGWALARRAAPFAAASILLPGDTVAFAEGARPLALTDTLWTRLPRGAEAAVAVWPLPGPVFAEDPAPAAAHMAEARLAAILLDLNDRLDRRAPAAGPFAVPGLCETLAAAAGLDTQPARCALEGMRHRGLVRCYGEVVAVCDRPGLAALATHARGVRA